MTLILQKVKTYGISSVHPLVPAKCVHIVKFLQHKKKIDDLYLKNSRILNPMAVEINPGC